MQKTNLIRAHFKKIIVILFLFGLLAPISFFAYKVYSLKQGSWFPAYLSSLINGSNNIFSHEEAEHVIFLIVDHHEHPYDTEKAKLSVKNWSEKYRETIKGISDHYGNPFQYSWFYPIDHENDFVLGELNQLVFDDLGEIELHWHHAHENRDVYIQDLDDGINRLNSYGAILSADENFSVQFGFIHGNWALDNSAIGRGGENICGINDEISILKEKGSYADFTFSTTRTDAQPSIFSSLYYVKDTPEPKSHEMGSLASVEYKPENEEYLIFQGPSAFDLKDRTFEHGEIESWDKFTAHRAKLWVKNAPFVEGQPKWRFVKTYTHGVQSKSKILSDDFSGLIKSLKKYCDDNNLKLHFVSSREAFNIVKAAEAGETGNPEEYKNYALKEPVNKVVNSRMPLGFIKVNESEIEFTAKVTVDNQVRFKHQTLVSVSGKFSRFSYSKLESGESNLKIDDADNMIVVSSAPLSIENVFELQKSDGLYYYKIMGNKAALSAL